MALLRDSFFTPEAFSAQTIGSDSTNQPTRETDASTNLVDNYYPAGNVQQADGDNFYSPDDPVFYFSFDGNSTPVAGGNHSQAFYDVIDWYEFVITGTDSGTVYGFVPLNQTGEPNHGVGTGSPSAANGLIDEEVGDEMFSDMEIEMF